jgi:hypothetical protein
MDEAQTSSSKGKGREETEKKETIDDMTWN